jgi:adenylate kinase family enzyme
MAYPYQYGYEEQTKRMQDLEYIQQLYPMEAKNILRKVIYHLDPIDYKGSFLYDEYPDQLQLYRVVASIFAEMQKENAEKGETWSPEREMWLQDMIKLVLYQELFKRRYKNPY